MVGVPEILTGQIGGLKLPVVVLVEEVFIQKVTSVDLEQVTLNGLFVWLKSDTHTIPCDLLI